LTLKIIYNFNFPIFFTAKNLTFRPISGNLRVFSILYVFCISPFSTANSILQLSKYISIHKGGYLSSRHLNPARLGLPAFRLQLAQQFLNKKN